MLKLPVDTVIRKQIIHLLRDILTIAAPEAPRGTGGAASRRNLGRGGGEPAGESGGSAAASGGRGGWWEPVGVAQPGGAPNLLDSYAVAVLLSFLHVRVPDALMALSMHRATGEVDEELERLGMQLLSQILRYASLMLPEQLNQMLFSLGKLMDTAAMHTVSGGLAGITSGMQNRSRAMQANKIIIGLSRQTGAGSLVSEHGTSFET